MTDSALFVLAKEVEKTEALAITAAALRALATLKGCSSPESRSNRNAMEKE